jgi:hypothetical protein
MSGGSSAPAPPDYSGVANASRESAKEYAAIMREQLAWAKEQYADNKAFADQVKDVFASDMQFNSETARKDRARYEQYYQPLENDLVDDAKSYATDERKELERGRSMGTVSQQFDTAGEAAKRQLESFGIDPSATRYAALDLGVKTQKAAAMAAAANQSDVMVEDRGRALRSEAINVGKGYPGQIAGQFGSSTTGGSAGVGAQNSTYSASAPALGNPAAFGGLQNQAIGQWGNTLNNQYQNQIAQYNANSSQSSGIGSTLGSLAGIAGGLYMMSDEHAKDNIEPIGETYDGQEIIKYNLKGDPKTQIGLSAQETAKRRPEAVARGRDGLLRVNYDRALPTDDTRRGNRYAEGGAVSSYLDEYPEDLSDEAGEYENMDGGVVPPEMSPSRGRAIDDVPAQTFSQNGQAGPKAAIDVGEFIFPEDVTRWYGEEKLQKLIEKARQAKQGATAKPEMRAALPV